MPLPPSATWLLAAWLPTLSPGCEAQVEAVPEGALALVGQEVVDAERLEGTQAQLVAYGQARFRGPHGQRALLDAVIQEELLVQEARDAGLADDPRVEWAVLEELAALQRAAMLERRLPRAEVAADTQALRARYQRELASFTEPERRSLRAIRFATFDEAERALAQLQGGVVELEAIAANASTPESGEILQTTLMKRDDQEFPAYHRVLFDPALAVGDPLPVPVLSGSFVLIGVIAEIQPAAPRPFEDPQVQEQLVTAERAERLQAVEAALLDELRQRYPAADP